ncbi:GAF domain-containing protein [Kosmotoga pacifica]|uniref:Histidine kinase n=1 Tax=Kosmotoga pacifica TaxID=1330330 RepID=A0A0G2ZDS5_9BACT|nr:GAF domain-containing protein [Kosmotoga pacifica]AKI96943.1 histidine kinase [Kosmotoga pacifica]
MRSILRDFSEEFFTILSFPKEKWFSFWLEHRKDHPRIWEEYLMKNSLNERDVEETLSHLERRELDRLYHEWQIVQAGIKSKVLKSLKGLANVLDLSREDFVVYLMVALGKADRIFVPTSRGHVIMIDLLSLYRKGLLKNADEHIIEKMKEFRAFSKLAVFSGATDEEKSMRFERLYEMLKTELSPLSFEEAMKTIVRLLDHYVEYYNWTGFYLVDSEKQLVLGPFVGEPTEHVKISFGRGICGQAALTKETFLVPDVSKEENYLSCSEKTKSEIVVPIIDGDDVIGEIDIDSHHADAFSGPDEEFLKKICQLLLEKRE